MKIKKKLRDLTKEEYQDYKKDGCNSNTECSKCIFGSVNCTSEDEGCWVLNKDTYSDKFLDQEVEIEVPDILTKEEKEYLSAVMKPFKDNIKYISKCDSTREHYEYIVAFISSKRFPDNYMHLPYFEKGSMYKGMRAYKEYTPEDLGLFKEQKPESTSVSAEKKITLTDFWNSKEKLVIHCDTEEKANKLLKAFDKLNKKWNSGMSYLKNNEWKSYEKETCYSNRNEFCDYDYYRKQWVVIYEFDDIDLDN